MDILKKKYESTMYALERSLHANAERDFLEDIKRYVHKLEILSKIDNNTLIEGRLDDAVQLLDAWQTSDPEHHYDEFNPESLGCITRAFLEKIK